MIAHADLGGRVVSPLPIAIPTYGHGMQSKKLLRLALLVYSIIFFFNFFNRNKVQ
jgi:hypothetical protein